jgi:nucleoside-diphosphate-sugar epimerase
MVRSPASLPFSANKAGADIQIAEVADIAAPHAFRDAIKGASVFCHVATAVPTDWTKPTREYAQEIIDAANASTKAALEAAAEEPALKSFIMTSSCAANIDFGGGPAQAPALGLNEVTESGPNGKHWDETTWNNITLEEALTGDSMMSAYSYGKTESEKAVWALYKSGKASFRIATVLPSYTFGEHIGIPGSKEEPVVATNGFIKPLLTDPHANLSVMLGGANNVRAKDVAIAHWLAATNPEADGKRIVLAMPEVKFLSDYVKFFRKRYPGLKTITEIPEGFVEPADYKVDGSSFERIGGKCEPSSSWWCWLTLDQIQPLRRLRRMWETTLCESRGCKLDALVESICKGGMGCASCMNGDELLLCSSLLCT